MNLNISWSSSPTPGVSYKASVYRNGGLVGNVSLANNNLPTYFLDWKNSLNSILKNGDDIYVEVIAISTTGKESIPLSGTYTIPDDIPAPPTNLTFALS